MSTQSQAALYILSGLMDPAQATTNPDDIGNGTGTISGSYDDVTKLLNYSIDWMNLTTAVTNMHFHVGAPGVPGGVDLAIPGPWSGPQIGTDVALTGPQEANLLSGNWYVNIHTADFGAGEIRGQVIVNVDTDGDGNPDVTDPDDDNDGIGDAYDTKPTCCQ